VNRSSIVKGLFLLLLLQATADASEKRESTLYNADSQHLWNRLHAALFVRPAADGKVYGYDRLDPMLWIRTTYLVSGPSHTDAVELLDQFIDQRGEQLIDDPLKRALLQNQLWSVFDWVVFRHRSNWSITQYHNAERTLRTKLAAVIRRLALTPREIRSLPNNYSTALKAIPNGHDAEHPEQHFLPPGLFDEAGPWACLNDNRGDSLTPFHDRQASRSTFLVFLKLPAGRDATIKFLNQNLSGRATQVYEKESNTWTLNRDLPQFPAGTQVALVRQMMLVDSKANIVGTNLTERVELRVYRDVPADPVDPHISGVLGEQDFYMFNLSRRSLLEGKAGLHPPKPGDIEVTFPEELKAGTDSPEAPNVASERVLDTFDEKPRLISCHTCHSLPGIHSVKSIVGGQRTMRPSYSLSENKPKWEKNGSLGRKRSSYEWGLLQGLLEGRSPKPH